MPKPSDPLAESVDLGIAGPPKADRPGIGEARRGRHRGAAQRGTEIQSPGGGRRAAPDEQDAEVRPQALDRPSRGPKAATAQRTTSSGTAGPAELGVRDQARTADADASTALLLVIVPCLVIATVAWRYRQQVRQGYPAIVEKGRTEGIKALDEGDFDKAYQLLSAAQGRPSMGWGGQSKAPTRFVRPPTRPRSSST